jgi:hypothetical protein
MMNTLQLNISSKADPAGILVTLTETTPDSGIFEGTFGITDKDSTGNSLKVNPLTGDKIEISYDASHPRGKVEVSGLTQSGTAQIEEISLPKSNNPSVLTSNAMNVTVSGGAQLPDFRCSEIRDIPELSGEPCYSINITMSYANLPLTFEKTPEFCASCGETQPPGITTVTATPSELTIYAKEGNSWSDVGSATIDENAKTVTAPDVFFSPSRLYIIGVSGANAFHCPSSGGTFGTTAAGGGCGGGAGGSGGGGGGGGLALPGDGVVLDFIVPVAGAPQSPPSSPSSEPSTGPSAEREGDRETGGIGSTDTTTDTSDLSNRSEKAAVTELETLHPLSDSLPGSLAQGSVGENSGIKSGNVTIVVPGEGTITLAYQRLLSDENLTVTPIKNMSEISSLKVTKKSSDGQGTMVTSNNTKYTTVGTIFTIGPSDTRFNDSIIVTIPYDKSQAADKKGEEIRILQDTGTFWEDITTLPAADGSSVTGSISMLGPVVAAIRENNS